MARTIRVAQGDLTEGEALLLVNASNTNAALGTGVSGAIRRACGAGYQKRIQQALQDRFNGPMEPGQVLVTDAGSHPKARWVAHVAVMDYRQGFTGSSFPTEETIERGCRNLWQAVEELGAKEVSVAMVALGAGTGNLGLRRSVEIGCRTLAEHLSKNPQSAIGDVTFYGYELHEFVVTLEVVREHFAVPEECIPEELRR
ncbi:MAG: macro domain-containing protein [Deltaproteobacteria bacterium]|nr:macro domain-containing protein [Deltaproteobacteria bacterium]